MDSMTKSNSEFFLDRYGKEPQAASDTDKRQEYFRLMDLAKNKGFKPGFAAHKYRELFGDFPPFSWQDEWQAGSQGLARPPQDKVRCSMCHGSGWMDDPKITLADGSSGYAGETQDRLDEMSGWDKDRSKTPAPSSDVF